MIIGSVVGPVGSMRVMLEEFLNTYLPSDIAYIQKKLFISSTLLPMFTQEIRSTFRSKQDLILYILGTLYIPVITYYCCK